MSGAPLVSEIRTAYTNEAIPPPTDSDRAAVLRLCQKQAKDPEEALRFAAALGLLTGYVGGEPDADRRASVHYHTNVRVTGRRIA